MENQTPQVAGERRHHRGVDASFGHCHDPRETSAGPVAFSQLERAGVAANGKTDPAPHQEALNFVSLCEWMEAAAGAIISTS